MSVLALVQTPADRIESASVLRTPARDIRDFGPDLQRLIEDMIDTLFHYKVAVGLAAAQVGYDFRLAVINVEKVDRDATLILVNPVMESSTGKKDRKKESCMSLPGVRGNVVRRDRISIHYQDRRGEQRRIAEHGFMARVIAHELDHLDGKLYVDRMEPGEALEPSGMDY